MTGASFVEGMAANHRMTLVMSNHGRRWTADGSAVLDEGGEGGVVDRTGEVRGTVQRGRLWRAGAVHSLPLTESTSRRAFAEVMLNEQTQERDAIDWAEEACLFVKELVNKLPEHRRRIWAACATGTGTLRTRVGGSPCCSPG